ncbi:TVP38/TMEM64 family membrane protein slr0305 [Linum perenne]
MGRRLLVGIAIAAVGILIGNKQLGIGFGLDKEAGVQFLAQWSDRLGPWAMPLYVGVHSLTLALCLPFAVFFEAAASLLFGFFPALLCVFSAKVLGASLSFWIGRLVFRRSKSAAQWVQGNKYFNILSKGVERDGWRFVLLARFSPVPSYMINYALAATGVGFFLDFLLPTVVGCLPMILQNTSIGSLAGAAVSSASGGAQKSKIWSYLFPLLGISSSIVITLRIRKYTADFKLVESDGGNASSSSQAGENQKKKISSS